MLKPFITTMVFWSLLATAVSAQSETVTHGPAYYQSLKNQALEHIGAGRMKVGLRLLSELPTEDQSDARVWLAYRLTHLLNGLNKEADTAFRELAEVEWNLLHGSSEGAFDRVQSILENPSAEKLHPRARQIQLGLIHAAMNEESSDFFSCGEEASREVYSMLETALINNPVHHSSSEILFLQGLFFEQSNQPEMAYLHYKYASERDPDGMWAVPAMFCTGRTLYQEAVRHFEKDSASEAIGYLDQLIDLFPHDERTPAAKRMRISLVDRLAEQAYETALYYDSEDATPQQALLAYAYFLQEHPGTSYGESVLQRMRTLQAVVEAQSGAGKDTAPLAEIDLPFDSSEHEPALAQLKQEEPALAQEPSE